MPPVRCPTCRRALNLPEHIVGQSVRCPLCDTVFATGEREKPWPLLTPPLTVPANGPAGAHKVPGAPVEDLDVEDPGCGVSGAARVGRRLAPADLWLSVTAVLWLIQTVMTVLCCQYDVLVPPTIQLSVWAWVAIYGAMMARLSLPFTYAGAFEARDWRQYPRVAWLGSIVLFADSVVVPGLLWYVWQHQWGQGHSRPGPFSQVALFLLAALTVVTSVCGLIGSIKVFLVLSSPNPRQPAR
jgi:LSD1 subclass zinc finger protein